MDYYLTGYLSEWPRWNYASGAPQSPRMRPPVKFESVSGPNAGRQIQGHKVICGAFPILKVGEAGEEVSKRKDFSLGLIWAGSIYYFLSHVVRFRK